MELPANSIDIQKNAEAYLFGNEKLEEWGDNLHGIGLLKDNRESLGFNYNLQVITDSDRFVLSAYMWQIGKSNLKIALLSEEVNKISNETISDDIITNNLFDLVCEKADSEKGGIKVNIKSVLETVDMSAIKSIAIISTNEVNDYINSGAKYFIMARNVDGLKEDEKKKDWYVSNVGKSLFSHQ